MGTGLIIERSEAIIPISPAIIACIKTVVRYFSSTIILETVTVSMGFDCSPLALIVTGIFAIASRVDRLAVSDGSIEPKIT